MRGATAPGASGRSADRRPHLVGVDPADSIWSNPALDERFQQSLEDFARAHEAAFDVAFAVFVLEHVADPPAFSSACARVLRPGGVFLGLTVNKYHYFGFATWATTPPRRSPTEPSRCSITAITTGTTTTCRRSTG